MKVSISQAAKELGVTAKTLRRWEEQDKIDVERTVGGHRRYDLAKLQGLVPRKPQPGGRITIGYARVSSHDQKEDLGRQVALIESFCAANGWTFEIVEDMGSGLNYRKRGLRQLIKRICSGEVGRVATPPVLSAESLALASPVAPRDCRPGF